MRNLSSHFKIAAARFWRGFRQATGDAAYESYLRSTARRHSNCCDSQPPLSRRDFYLDSIRRRYSGISRCC